MYYSPYSPNSLPVIMFYISCGMVQALMAMVNFCDGCLRKNEEGW